MNETTTSETIPRSYYVDEAGDGTLFGRKGRVIIGTEGCSRFFILGVLDIPNSAALGEEMEALRQGLLADPYFSAVPSMQPAQQKTALAFHAKDDASEVRWQVFSLLRRHEELRFFAVVKDKRAVLDYVLQRNTQDSAYRYNPNELYDYLVRRLFKNLLHKDDAYEIYFAKRGRSDRTAALREALAIARARFTEQWKKQRKSKLNVIATTPKKSSGLQAADYFLWALQRFYERGEDRYLAYLWPAFHLVQDIDDTRIARYGAYYSQRKPLTLQVLENRVQ